MATIGHTLAAARIAAGYTVADLSTRTRIREPVLRAIEAEDFVPCGGDFYARGHIRGVCRALGLDPDPLLAEFDRDHANKTKPAFVPLQRHPSATPEAARAIAAARAAQRPDDDTMAGPLRFGDDDPADGPERWGHFERRRRVERGVRGRPPRGRVPAPRAGRRADEDRGRPAGQGRAPTRPEGRGRPAPRAGLRPGERVRRHWPWAVVGVILVLAVFVGVRAWQGWEGEPPVRSAVESGSVVGPAGDGDRDGSAKASVADVPETAPPTKFTVGVAASDRTWLKVTGADGEDVFTGFLLAGQTQEYTTDGPLRLWVGRAGALRVSVDGKDLGPAGASGAVKEVTVDADGFAE
jgi:hypothetical protein